MVASNSQQSQHRWDPGNSWLTGEQDRLQDHSVEVVKVGRSAALVYGVITMAAQSDRCDVMLSYNDIAKRTGTSPATAKRAIYRLAKAGLLGVDPCIKDHWQQGNRYRILHADAAINMDRILVPAAAADHDQRPGQNDQASAGNRFTSESVCERDKAPSFTNECQVLPGHQGRSYAATTELTTTVTSANRRYRNDIQAADALPPHPGPPPGTRVRTAQLGRNLFVDHRAATWCVALFEYYVARSWVSHESARSFASQRITDRRRDAWTRAALTARSQPDAPSLDELAAALDWLFTHASGYLPFSVPGYGNRPGTRKDRKITHIAKVFKHYPRIVAAMRAADCEDGAPNDSSAPRGSYDTGEGFSREEEVEELVELFSASTNEKPTTFYRSAWAKTFRIMLHHDGRSVDDIKHVVTHLEPLKHRLRHAGRYQSAYGVRQHWDELLREVDELLATTDIQRELVRRGTPLPVSEMRSWVFDR